jgi:hypothetical protein
MMQTQYDPELVERYEARHNLWVFSSLAKILPLTIGPLPTPSEEAFFSESFVAHAYSEMQPESGRSIGAAALHVCKGAPLEATRYGTSIQLRQMVRGDLARPSHIPHRRAESKMMANVRTWVKSNGEFAVIQSGAPLSWVVVSLKRGISA